jgi:predicted transcriptional regulator
MILQKVKTQVEGSYELAYKYFSIMSIINGWELVKRDVQLISFAISENKDVSEVRDEFVNKFNSSKATVGNIISKLYKRNILKKQRRVVKINPALLFDFNDSLGLGIEFDNGNKG